MKITILYDNNAKPGLRPGWGFSCLIESENNKKILFDTGADSEILLYNMKQLKIDLKTIDIVVLSHNHWDHIGGLDGFLKANENKAKIYQPTDFSKPTKISEGIYSTGALGTLIKEQSLIIKTKKGLVVIIGCAHPGLENIINIVKPLGKIYAIIGGFHGFSKLEKLQGIELIAPCHCTQYKQEIKEKYPKNYKKVMAGGIIEI